jgi:hypothetical protein
MSRLHDITRRETLSLKRYKDELWAVKSRNIINEQNLTARVDNIHLVLSSISVIVTGQQRTEITSIFGRDQAKLLPSCFSLRFSQF